MIRTSREVLIAVQPDTRARLFPERRKASGVFISEKFDDAMDSMSDSAKKELLEALTAVVKERRLCAQLLSKPYERGTYEATMARFVELQTTIEAIERALVSEADYP